MYPSLASAVLDTLLCILVDAPPALRAFEQCNGIEGVVKTLKRTGVARDVRYVLQFVKLRSPYIESLLR